jgi:hypothetical protein
MTNDTDQITMDESDIERVLRKRIEKQAAMIWVALGYIHAGRPDLAAKVLESARV